MVRLAQTGSVSRTARDLGVPRSTISRRLARLEAALGVTLAERTTRSFRLTDEGRHLAEGATRALAELRTVREAVVHAGGSVRGWLRVCTPPGLGGPLLGRFLMAFRAKFPDIRVELTVLEHVPHLLDEPFDVVFALGQLQDAPWLRHHVGQIWYLAVAHPDYLEARGRPGKVEDLEQHVLLGVRSGDLSPDAWPLHDGGNIAVEPQFLTTDLGAVVDAARAGMGIALVPIHLAAEDLMNGRLQTVLADRVGRHVEAYLLYPPERRQSPVIQALLGSIDDFGASLLEEIPQNPAEAQPWP